MGVRWLVGGTVLAFGLACAGGGPTETPPPEKPPPIVPDPSEPDAPKVEVPDLLTPFLPPTPAPSEVTAIDGIHRARYDDLSVDVAVRGWGGPIGTVKRTDKRVIGGMWAGDRVVLAVVDDLEPGLLVSVDEKVPDLKLGSEGCGEGQVAVRVPWPGGASLAACLVVGGVPTPIGPFRIERNGVGVVEGAWSAEGLREGGWTLRDDGGQLVATGAYVASVPVGVWTFSVDGVERSVSYVDGIPTDVPSAQLPSSRIPPRTTATSKFEILDVDLAAGWVAASERWTLPDDPSAPVRACPAAGRLDPKEGLRLILLRAGFRTPVGEWTVFDTAVGEGACTTEDAAAAAITAANAAFVEHGLDPLGKTALVPPTGGTTPFQAGAEPTRFVVGAHTVSIRASNKDLPLEEQLQVPDLLAGSWVTDTRQVVRSAAVAIDGQEVDTLWIRWPAECPGGANVEGAIVDTVDGRDLVSVVYRSVDVSRPADALSAPTCAASGSLWTVGGPIHLDPAGDLDGADEHEEVIE